MQKRLCLCEYCIAEVKSRGEKIFTREMTYEDCTDDELDIDVVVCDWCEEDYTVNEMYVCRWE